VSRDGTVEAPRAVTDPAPLLALFERDRSIHPYGIADVEQLWDVSRWWCRREAAVGLLDLPGSPTPVVYAVSARDPDGTSALLADLAPWLPQRFVMTAPRGTARRLAGTRRQVWRTDYLKMALTRPASLPPPEPRVLTLRRADLVDLEALYAADADAGGFFHVGLLDTGAYLGIRDAGRLVATAGVHVLDEVNRVAAIGNVATDPAHRRKGLGTAVVASLCHQLLDRVEVVGLNVAEANVAGRRLYERLGFEVVAAYEEGELAPRA
jgi:ribosomal protein S18 acetylase RimI-like enzyme